MTYSITITNSNGKKFRFYAGEVGSASYRLSSKLLKQSLPDSPPEDAIVINLGREKTITFPFKLITTTEDASVTTQVGGIYTPGQKFIYLDETIVTNGIEDTYEVEIKTHNVTITKTCIIENLNFDFSSERPGYIPGDMTFSVGGI